MKGQVLFVIVYTILGCVLADWPLQVQTDKGSIVGFKDNNVNYFLGIPYAQPPIGSLRWAPPQPHQPWSGMLRTTEFSSACLQPIPNPLSDYTFPDNVTFSEDCLYLNVYAPNTPDPNKAVMVWIHGGGLLNGGNSEYRLRGEYMAQTGDVVVVVINYRLGVFGWLAHPAFINDNPNFPSSGNYGFLDQRLSLQRVQNNIALFGGDPKKVTIMGESAGGSSVCFHLVSQKSQGLYSKAIVESGACLAEVSKITDAQTFAVNFQNKMKCTGTPSQIIQCMRSVPAPQVEALQQTGAFSQAVVDGYTFLEHPYTSISNGRYNSVPLIAGNVKDEGSLFIGHSGPIDSSSYMTRLDNYFKGFASQVFNQYPCAAYNASDCWYALMTAYGDYLLTCPTKFISDAFAVSGSTYSYVFTHQPYWALIKRNPYGAFHSSEIPFVFSTLTKIYNYTPPEVDLERQMTKFWTNFGKSGNPNTEGIMLWPVYQSPDYSETTLDLTLTIVQKYKKLECALWNTLYKNLYNF